MKTDNVAELWTAAVTRGLPVTGNLLLVNTDEQCLRLVRSRTVIHSYPISTSRYGLGNRIDSYQTPTGMHEVLERYGDGEVAGRVFFEREAVDRIIPPSEWKAATREDLILTRIMRLGGLDEGINRGGEVDTFERYIYIHGSNNEAALGKTPSSHGCIHVGNERIIDLFEQTKHAQTWCWIA